MKELNLMPIINPEEENNNENEKEDYNYSNKAETLIKKEKEKKNNIDFNDIIKVKDSTYYKNCIKSFCKIFALFALIYLFYIFSLEGCYEGEDECSIKIGWIYLKIIEEIISCVALVLAIQLMIFKIISRLHLVHLIIIFPLFYVYSHGLDFPDHGYFNFFYYFVVFILLMIIIQPLTIIIYCIKKKNINKIILLIYILMILIFFSLAYIYFIYIPSNCDDWGKGLNNTYLENDIEKHGCQIQYPKRCGYAILKNYQDYTKMRNKDCKTFKKSNPRETILKRSRSPYINKDAKKIGFPLTNKDPICFEDFRDEGNKIYNYVFQHLVDMDNNEILNKDFKDKRPEVMIDFTDNEQGNMIINVEFNQTLSSERKLLEKNSIPYSNNILMIYIDSVSRVNAKRQMKKTLSFIEKFMKYKGDFNEKYPSENFHSFQFFKYHAFQGFTQGNFPYLYYGRDKKDPKKILITKYLKDVGYVTSNVHDYCDIENTRSYHDFTIEEVFDHQLLICDTNNEHPSLTSIRCLYGKQNFEQLFEYTNQFWRKYKDNRKYSMLVTNHGHEGTLSVIKYADEVIYKYLNGLYEDNLLKDSSVFLVSDHGAGMPSVYYIYDFYTTEIHLPMLYVIINDRKNKTYEEQYEYIHKNQQTLITAFDIYNTIGYLAYGDKYASIKNKTALIDTPKSEYGKSLFDKINSKERNPKIYTKIKGSYEMSVNICK